MSLVVEERKFRDPAAMFGLSWMKGKGKGQGGPTGGGPAEKAVGKLVGSEWAQEVKEWGEQVAGVDLEAVRAGMHGVSMVSRGSWVQWVGWVEDRLAQEMDTGDGGWLDGVAGVVLAMEGPRRAFPGDFLERVSERTVTVRFEKGARRMRVAVLSLGQRAWVDWQTGEEEEDWGQDERWSEEALEIMVQGVWEDKWSDDMRWWEVGNNDWRGMLAEWGGSEVFDALPGGGGLKVQMWDAKKEQSRVGLFGEGGRRVEMKFRVRLVRIQEVLKLSGRWVVGRAAEVGDGCG